MIQKQPIYGACVVDQCVVAVNLVEVRTERHPERGDVVKDHEQDQGTDDHHLDTNIHATEKDFGWSLLQMSPIEWAV